MDRDADNDADSFANADGVIDSLTDSFANTDGVTDSLADSDADSLANPRPACGWTP